MSDNGETIVKADNEEEIEIKINEADDKNNKTINENDMKDDSPKDKSTQPITPLEEGRASMRVIENKPINELSDIERAVIVANAKNGIDMPFFDVKFFGNGKYRIVKKKPVKPSTSQKVIKASVSNSPDIKDPDRKVYYTNDQLLMEHIIELNSKVDKLMTKHKKLKRKYQSLSADIYVEDNEEIHNEQPHDDEQCSCRDDKQTDDKNKSHTNDEPINEQHKNILRNITSKNIKVRSSWRNQLNYL